MVVWCKLCHTLILNFGFPILLATDMIYSDLNPDQMNALPDTAFHRNVELMVLDASSKVKTHIVSPPTIYGIADHALVQKGISNSISIQVPTLIRAGIDRGQAGMVGKGLNVWPLVHISESTYLLLCDRVDGLLVRSLLLQLLRPLLQCWRQHLRERQPLVAKGTILQVCEFFLCPQSYSYRRRLESGGEHKESFAKS